MINFILLAAVAVIILVAIMLVALNLGALVGGEWCESHKDNGWFSAVLAVIFGVGMAVILIVGMNNTFGVVGVLGCIAAEIPFQQHSSHVSNRPAHKSNYIPHQSEYRRNGSN